MNRRHPGRRRSRGFTLIELLVALCVGLLISLAVFTFLRGGMKTFAESQRTNEAEFSLRSAVERVRVDLQRAAFMSVGNVKADTRARVATNAQTADGIRGLGAIRYNRGASTAHMTVAGADFATLNGLNPDSIDIAGNFTTTDDFAVEQPQDNGTCWRFWLNPNTASVSRLVGGGISGDGGADSVRQAFQPIAPGETARFIVRIVDGAGCQQFLPTCPGSANAAGVTGGRPYVDVEGPPVLLQGGADQCGIDLACKNCRVNPVQWVRWEVSPVDRLLTATGQAAGIYTGLNEQRNDGGTGMDDAKFNLMRTYLDAARDYVGVPEVIAEYAVDLKLAFTVDDSPANNGTSPNLNALAFDDTNNDLWGVDVASMPWGGVTPSRGPQRIRAVRVRLATRASQPDRDSNLPGPTGSTYLYRYCTQAVASLANCRQFARVRTVTTEVQLMNTARMFY